MDPHVRPSNPFAQNFGALLPVSNVRRDDDELKRILSRIDLEKMSANSFVAKSATRRAQQSAARAPQLAPPPGGYLGGLEFRSRTAPKAQATGRAQISTPAAAGHVRRDPGRQTPKNPPSSAALTNIPNPSTFAQDMDEAMASLDTDALARDLSADRIDLTGLDSLTEKLPRNAPSGRPMQKGNAGQLSLVARTSGADPHVRPNAGLVMPSPVQPSPVQPPPVQPSLSELAALSIPRRRSPVLSIPRAPPGLPRGTLPVVTSGQTLLMTEPRASQKHQQSRAKRSRKTNPGVGPGPQAKVSADLRPRRTTLTSTGARASSMSLSGSLSLSSSSGLSQGSAEQSSEETATPPAQTRPVTKSLTMRTGRVGATSSQIRAPAAAAAAARPAAEPIAVRTRAPAAGAAAAAAAARPAKEPPPKRTRKQTRAPATAGKVAAAAAAAAARPTPTETSTLDPYHQALVDEISSVQTQLISGHRDPNRLSRVHPATNPALERILLQTGLASLQSRLASSARWNPHIHAPGACLNSSSSSSRGDSPLTLTPASSTATMMSETSVSPLGTIHNHYTCIRNLCQTDPYGSSSSSSSSSSVEKSIAEHVLALKSLVGRAPAASRAYHALSLSQRALLAPDPSTLALPPLPPLLLLSPSPSPASASVSASAPLPTALYALHQERLLDRAHDVHRLSLKRISEWKVQEMLCMLDEGACEMLVAVRLEVDSALVWRVVDKLSTLDGGKAAVRGGKSRGKGKGEEGEALVGKAVGRREGKRPGDPKGKKR